MGFDCFFGLQLDKMKKYVHETIANLILMSSDDGTTDFKSLFMPQNCWKLIFLLCLPL